LPTQYPVQYLGSEHTEPCLLAVSAILNSGTLPESAIIVSYFSPPNAIPPQGQHLFIFRDWHHFPITVVHCGFTSGYTGQGPKGFSLAICMIVQKGIPLSEIEVNEAVFLAIDQGKAQINVFKKIFAESRKYNYPNYGYIFPEHDELMKRDKLWREFYWCSEEPDLISELLADIDDLYPEVSRRLRTAMQKVAPIDGETDLQHIGILIRDAWIDFAETVCNEQKADLSEIGKHDVKAMLGKLKVNDEIMKHARTSYDLSTYVHHNRNIQSSAARACVLSTTAIMKAIIDNLAKGN
jgi:hypothetical protein